MFPRQTSCPTGNAPALESFGAKLAAPHLAEWVVLLIALGQFGCDRAGSTDSPENPTPPTEPPQVQLVPITNMVSIQAGTFDRLGHAVTLTRDFWLGKFEVTQAEYAALTGTNPSHFNGNPNAPVEKLSQADAAAYCAALTTKERKAGRLPPGFAYRLPTEAEWEYACRAGTTNALSFGSAEADAFAWTIENSGGTTHPIGQKEPNPWGLYDMHGNVWEWCGDWFAQYPKQDLTDPTGPEQGEYKVFRGGGWNQEIDFARCANRFMMAPSNGIYFVGFRVALAPAQ